MNTTNTDPLRYYRAQDLIDFGYSPYRDVKTTRTWMRKIGGKNLSQRTFVVTGQDLINAAKNGIA
jgi:hypothetical protein